MVVGWGGGWGREPCQENGARVRKSEDRQRVREREGEKETDRQR